MVIGMHHQRVAAMPDMRNAAREEHAVEPELRRFEQAPFLRQAGDLAPGREVALIAEDRRNALRGELRVLPRQNLLHHRRAFFRRLRDAERDLAFRFQLAEFRAVDAPRLRAVALREFLEARRQVEHIGRVRRGRGRKFGERIGERCARRAERHGLVVEHHEIVAWQRAPHLPPHGLELAVEPRLEIARDERPLVVRKPPAKPDEPAEPVAALDAERRQHQRCPLPRHHHDRGLNAEPLAHMAIPGGKPVKCLEGRPRGARLEIAPHRLRRLETFIKRDPRRMGEASVISGPEARRGSPRPRPHETRRALFQAFLARNTHRSLLTRSLMRIVPFRDSRGCSWSGHASFRPEKQPC